MAFNIADVVSVLTYICGTREEKKDDEDDDDEDEEEEEEEESMLVVLMESLAAVTAAVTDDTVEERRLWKQEEANWGADSVTGVWNTVGVCTAPCRWWRTSWLPSSPSSFVVVMNNIEVESVFPFCGAVQRFATALAEASERASAGPSPAGSTAHANVRRPPAVDGWLWRRSCELHSR